MLEQQRINYTNEKTNLLHDLVDELSEILRTSIKDLYEAIMDGEDKDAAISLNELGKRIRDMRGNDKDEKITPVLKELGKQVRIIRNDTLLFITTTLEK